MASPLLKREIMRTTKEVKYLKIGDIVKTDQDLGKTSWWH